jgi:hypothetical protein
MTMNQSFVAAALTAAVSLETVGELKLTSRDTDFVTTCSGNLMAGRPNNFFLTAKEPHQANAHLLVDGGIMHVNANGFAGVVDIKALNRELAPGEFVIFDLKEGKVVFCPSPETIERYKASMHIKSEPAVTEQRPDTTLSL